MAERSDSKTEKRMELASVLLSGWRSVARLEMLMARRMVMPSGRVKAVWKGKEREKPRVLMATRMATRCGWRRRSRGWICGGDTFGVAEGAAEGAAEGSTLGSADGEADSVAVGSSKLSGNCVSDLCCVETV